MKKQKRRDVQEARKMHIEAKKILQQEMENKQSSKEKEMTITPQQKIQHIYRQARQQQKQTKEELSQADNEPTVLHQMILPDDPTEELPELQEPEPKRNLQEQIQNISNISHLTNKEKKEILNLALKVKELQDNYDLLLNNIIALYHISQKQK